MNFSSFSGSVKVLMCMYNNIYPPISPPTYMATYNYLPAFPPT